MKHEKVIDFNIKKGKRKNKKALYLGITLLSFSLITAGLAFLSQQDYLSASYTLTHDQSENFYMTAAAFALLGLISLNSLRR